MAATKGCITRLQKEYKSLQREPVPHITAHPNPSNLLEWHFVLEGAAGSDYEGGVYHGRIVFPADYPFKPPSISMITPNGRFAVNTKLCLSISDFHPESWSPMWSTSTILTGLLSFMYDAAPTTGSVTTSKAEKQRLARESLAVNARNATFKRLFPEWVEEHARRQAAAEAAAAAAAAPPPAAASDPQQQQGQDGGGAAAAAQQKGGRQQGQGQEQQQPAAGPRPGTAGERRAAGAPPPPAVGSSVFTAALLVVVLAIAVLPLCSSDARAGLALLRGRWFAPPPGAP
ncbi:ubiquitin-conjugating enzyme E2-like [Raphidocelis subcapitata]|uniref:E2 ubiquitin-conjugating enzyme n=1 Tax=Raphidocelis subcapitata TaxID=307507 RepID=A0A2V0NXI1_9CHLO|nr:ubiquitin-conjugating enzyme E2-like [Raphidocelis subcapitata]|eukprot:GBF91382.1 ubiquitin-conjugating enzyme E2-like [Raphidocelis subcapitata]